MMIILEKREVEASEELIEAITSRETQKTNINFKKIVKTTNKKLAFLFKTCLLLVSYSISNVDKEIDKIST